jgi:hypothetical protein
MQRNCIYFGSSVLLKILDWVKWVADLHHSLICHEELTLAQWAHWLHHAEQTSQRSPLPKLFKKIMWIIIWLNGSQSSNNSRIIQHLVQEIFNHFQIPSNWLPSLNILNHQKHVKEVEFIYTGFQYFRCLCTLGFPTFQQNLCMPTAPQQEKKTDGVIGIFHWHNPSGRTMVLGLIQPLTEISIRNISWG